MWSSWFKGNGAGLAAGSSDGSFPFVLGEVIVDTTGGAGVGGALVLGAGGFGVLRAGSGTGSSAEREVSIFVASPTAAAGPEATAAAEAAGAAVKRLKTLRHPSVLRFVDSSVSGNSTVLLATEPALPLLVHLKQQASSSEPPSSRQPSYLAWGVFQVFRAVAFLHDVAGLVHGGLHAGSVFVTPGGHWKLFGFERTAQPGQSAPPLLAALAKYSPPEAKAGSTTSSKSHDAWGLGVVIWETFNAEQLPAVSALAKLGRIPEKLAPAYMELVARDPSKRPAAQDKVKEMRRPGGFFHNDLIDTMVFFEEFQIKDESEKARFFSGLSAKLDEIPKEISTKWILDQLLKAFTFGNAGAQVLGPVFKIGKSLSTEEYQERIVPSLLKLFESNDRNARYKLLCQLENFAEHLSKQMVNNHVFPNIQNGFLDQQPAIREKTVIAMIHLAPKLTFANLDEGVVMKHFARLLRDEQPGIRTNTTVCLGKIASFLHYTTRQKVLVAALGGKVKDPFPPARIAAINAFAATQQYYSLEETSSRVLPVLCSAMTDQEKPVRDQAFKVAKGFMEKLEQVSENPGLKEEMEAEVKSTNSGPVLAAASGWASWAVGAIGAKFYKSTNKPTLAPVADDATSKATGVASSTSPSNTDQKPNSVPKASSTGGKGALKLASSSPKSSDVVTLDDLIDWSDDDKQAPSATDEGWDMDDGDWGSLESGPQEKFKSSVDNNSSSSSVYGWDSTGQRSQPPLEPPVKPRQDTARPVAQHRQRSAAESGSNGVGSPANQNADGWDDWGDSGSKVGGSGEDDDDKKKQREEKRLARQREIEAKRAARKASGGAMKLGSKMA